MQKIEIIGNIGKDPEVKQNGENKFITFPLAVSSSKGSTIWYTCAKNGANEKLVPYLKKGTKVFARGNLSVKEYMNSNNEKCFSLQCGIIELEFCGSSKQQEQGQEQPTPETYTQGTLIDIPPQPPKYQHPDLDELEGLPF